MSVTETPKKQKKSGTPLTTAMHAVADDCHIVGIGNLRVVIVQDESFWFAQGLEIDYAAQGKSLEDVKKSFEDGLCCSIHEHLTVYGTIENFLKPAPAQIWKELLYDQVADVKRYTQLSWHEDVSEKPMPNLPFPFQGIKYLQQQKKAA